MAISIPLPVENLTTFVAYDVIENLTVLTELMLYENSLLTTMELEPLPEVQERKNHYCRLLEKLQVYMGKHTEKFKSLPEELAVEVLEAHTLFQETLEENYRYIYRAKTVNQYLANKISKAITQYMTPGQCYTNQHPNVIQNQRKSFDIKPLSLVEEA